LEAKSSIFGGEFGLEISYLMVYGLLFCSIGAAATTGFGVSATAGLTGEAACYCGISVYLSSSKPSGFSITFLMS